MICDGWKLARAPVLHERWTSSKLWSIHAGGQEGDTVCGDMRSRGWISRAVCWVKKPRPEGHRTHDSIYLTFSNWRSHRDESIDSWSPGARIMGPGAGGSKSEDRQREGRLCGGEKSSVFQLRWYLGNPQMWSDNTELCARHSNVNFLVLLWHLTPEQGGG